MSEGFEECIDLSKEINDKIEQFARSHWIFTQDEWEDKVKSIKNSAIEEQKELIHALADHVLKSQFGYCITCENHMKNVTIDGVRNGCDGACSHSKEWTVEEFIDLFEKKLRLEKRVNK